jgi:tRNA threonylcarbamoyladenosine biosynthesis protein TsaE
MISRVNSNSPVDTFNIGKSIGEQLKGREIILLEGDLGAGKTIFTKGVAQALGIDPDTVVSPSFTLVNEFRCHTGRRFFHIDLYRLGPSATAALPEIDDYIDEGVIIIEWAQFLDPSYSRMEQTIQVRFQLSQTDDNTRSLEISSGLDYISSHL